ncbi:MAG: NADH-quinone oxidoreductase subunit H [Chitinophagales bacterium]
MNVLLFTVAGLLGGGLLTGLDRRITARLQGRVGPPLLQPFYDLVKLWTKEPLVAARSQVGYAVTSFGFGALAVGLLATGRDPLFCLFLLAGGDLALILGGLSVRSPYSRLGSYREILATVAVEPLLILAAVALGLGRVGPAAGLPLLVRFPLVFLGLVGTLPVKLRKSPFDLSTAHHAHQELVQGMLTEFAGPVLGVVELGHWLTVAFLMLMLRAFLPSALAGWALALGAYFAVTLLDNLTARLSWPVLIRLAWGGGALASLANLAWQLAVRG